MVKNCSSCEQAKSSTLISCKSHLEGTFERVDGIVFTATMTATGSGSNCKNAKLDSEKNINNTLEHFLNSYTPKIINKTYSINTECDKCVKPLTLYYRATVSPTDDSYNFNITNLVTNPDTENHLSAIAVLYMTESDFVTYNKDKITVSLYRIPKNLLLPEELQINEFYETYNIRLNNGDFVQGVASYFESGTNPITQIPEVIFNITTADGMFTGYKSFKVNYYNNGDPPGYTGLGPVRIITFE
jgi:hypothetical protein